jgi:nucleoside-diphosphate-sugar epimerase
MPPLLEGKTVVVTGAGGFIGPFVVHALLMQQARVLALMGAPGQTTCPPLPEVVPVIGDITDAAVISDLVDGSDLVVHLAGQASVRESFAQSNEYARVHVCGTATVLEACRKRGVKRFVYVSSAQVYGRPQTELVREDNRLEARSPYGAAKIAAEKLVEAVAYGAGMRAAVLRAFSIYGPGLSSQSVLGTILRQVQSSDCVELQDLGPVRDYCYVEDLADAIILSCTASFEGSCTMNIGTGIGTSVGQLARLVVERFGLDLPIREVKQKSVAPDLDRLVADPSLARQVLGWDAKTPLRLGIKKTIHSSAA